MQPLLFFLRKNTRDSYPNSFLRSALLWMAWLTAASTAYAQQPFITTWKTDNPGTSNSTSITIPTTGGGYNYEVDWNNDGTYEQTGINGNVTHDFGVAGTYTIQLRGTFPRIFFNNSGDRQKLLNIGQWGALAWTSMFRAFQGCINLNISTTDLPNLSGVTTMFYMFRGCNVLNGPTNIDTWNTAGVNNMSGMFQNTTAFNQPIGNWNTGLVTDMSFMFTNAIAFNQPLENWNTANVTNMTSMFNGATAFNQPIGNWTTTNVTAMTGVFGGATAFNQPIGNWNTTNVVLMDVMFTNAIAFNQPIGNWNTANVGQMSGMFNNAIAFNQPIGNWNIGLVTTLGAMFLGATAFNQSLENWTIGPVTSLTSMLNNTGMDCYHYSATLIGWSNNPLTPNGRSLGAAGRQYGTNAVAARTNLTANKGWTITGDAASGVDCSVPLPVGWLAFTGKAQANGVLLQWQTASEQNNAGFHVERSADGLRWTDIGFVAGKGLSTEAQEYAFLDEKPFLAPYGGMQGGLYYRLRQTDFDGKEELSKVVSVALQNVETVRVFPNPVSTGQLTLLLPENVEEATVQLFNSTGQLLRSVKIYGNMNALDISGLPTGIYTLQVGSSFEKIAIEN